MSSSAEVNREMNALYMPTHTKTISYVLGMLGGYFLIRVKRDHITFNIHRVSLSLNYFYVNLRALADYNMIVVNVLEKNELTG